jgi:hypothetical protein
MFFITGSESESILFRFEFGERHAGDFFQVFEGFEVAVLRSVVNDCGGFRTFEREATLEFDGGGGVDVDPGDGFGGEVFGEVVDDGSHFLVFALKPESDHFVHGGLPAIAILTQRKRAREFVALRAEARRFFFARAIGHLREQAGGRSGKQ